MKIGIFVNEEHHPEPIVHIIDEEIKKNNFVRDDVNPEIVFFVGGDGTFLKAIQYYVDKLDIIKFVGINNGHLGFFYDFDEADISRVFRGIIKKTLSVKKHRLLQADVLIGKERKQYFAINEIRIENPFRTLTCDVYINDTYLETYRGNGLVVASSLGSSAYNRSLGGAIINPSLDLMELTEIAGLQNNAFRSLGSSLVLGPKDSVTFSGIHDKVIVGYDNSISPSELPDIFKISLSNKTVQLMNSRKHSYIKNLNKSFVR